MQVANAIHLLNAMNFQLDCELELEAAGFCLSPFIVCVEHIYFRAACHRNKRMEI